MAVVGLLLAGLRDFTSGRIVPMSDDDVTPKLGAKRGKDGQRVLKYGSRILVAARLAGTTTGVVARRFDGSRIGRGASMGRLLSSRDRLAGYRGRRAIVKTRLVRLGAKGRAGAQAHLRYIQRDGVTREGAPGELYSRDLDQTDGKAFLDRCDGDRHQFRFIVSAEDGDIYEDLRPYTRRLMAQVEQDLGTKLDWVAVDHFNTGHPHTHIMLRGVDDQGQNLIIAREYIAHGLRERAAELVTLDLGPRTTQEIEARLRHDIGQERLTAIDRRMLKRIGADRVVAAIDRDPFHQSLAAGRLRKLEALGLAEPIGGGRYRVIEDLDDALRRLGERGDIIRTMQRVLAAQRFDRAGVDQVIATEIKEPVVGRVIHRGFSDEHHDRHYLMIDGIDGRVHYVDIGRSEATEPTPEGAIVRVLAHAADVRSVDRTIAEIAMANEGRYSIDLHLRHDPNATQAFAETHVRRLEAMRRARAGASRDTDGSWVIAPDHLDRVAVYEVRAGRDQPVVVEPLSVRSLDKLEKADAATWLDRELYADDPLPIRNVGFGREVCSALAVRRQWLIEQQLAGGEGGRIRLRANALMLLQRRELIGAGERIADELGKTFVETRSGDAVEGRIARRVDLISGRFALVEKAREFTLVPWRSVLEKQVGKSAQGIMRADGVSWRFGRERGGPEMS
jgi:type IV secretory pathway VirD2 relaxase